MGEIPIYVIQTFQVPISLTIIGRIESTTLKFINNTRQQVIRQTIFKMENIQEISLAFEDNVNFTTT